MLEGGGELNSLMEQLAARNKIDLKPVFQGTSLDQVSQVVQSGSAAVYYQVSLRRLSSTLKYLSLIFRV